MSTTAQVMAAAERTAALQGLDVDEWARAVMLDDGAAEADRARRVAYQVAAEIAESEGHPETASRLRFIAGTVDDQQAYFRAILGEAYKPRVWGVHGATHVTRIRRAMEIAIERGAPECADVIAALVFNRTLDRNREEFLAAEARPGARRRFGHSDDPAADFAAEVSAIAGAVAKPPGDPEGRLMLKMRISAAMSFRAGTAPDAIDAKARLRRLEAEADRWA